MGLFLHTVDPELSFTPERRLLIRLFREDDGAIAHRTVISENLGNHAVKIQIHGHPAMTGALRLQSKNVYVLEVDGIPVALCITAFSGIPFC